MGNAQVRGMLSRTGMTFPNPDGSDIGPCSPRDYWELLEADPDFRHVLDDPQVMTILTKRVIEEREDEPGTARRVPLEGHEYCRATLAREYLAKAYMLLTHPVLDHGWAHTGPQVRIRQEEQLDRMPGKHMLPCPRYTIHAFDGTGTLDQRQLEEAEEILRKYEM